MPAADTSRPAHVLMRRPFEYTSEGRTVKIWVDDHRDGLLTAFGKSTLDDRYLAPGETYQDLFGRVACANSDEIVWGEQSVGDTHAQRVYDAISLLWFMPATPVLSNSGLSRGLPISCYLNSIEDSMKSIADAMTENIWLAALGGGIGTFWGDIREVDHPIAGSLTGSTSGIIPFVHWMNAQTLAISQGSLRRGSAAAYITMRHPEIGEFIDIRRPSSGGDPRRKALDLHHGVMVEDEFMVAALSDDPEARKWELISPADGSVVSVVDARDLLIKLLITRLETGEPYIVFSDAVNKALPAIQKTLGLTVKQSNLCSEITLPTGKDHTGQHRTAVCCLSSINLETRDEWFGNEGFIRDFFHFLDNVMENFIRKTETHAGLQRARYAAIRERSLAAGMMGFHSYLQSKDLPFEGEHARRINIDTWEWLSKVGDLANVEMANDRGPCPDWLDAFELDHEAAGVARRNTNQWGIAPTASISIIAGGTSACGEPITANVYTHKTLSGSFEVRNRHLDKQLRQRYWQLKESFDGMNKTVRHILRETKMFVGLDLSENDWVERQWDDIGVNDGSVQHLPYLCDMEKATYRTAFEMDQRWVIKHAADRQPFIHQAQSVNIWLAADVHKRDLFEVHKFAWESGLKSLYYLRSRTASKAVAVGHLAGELPSANIEARAPSYSEPMECLSCQ